MTAKTITALTAAALLAVPASAGAHVTVQPTEAPAGGFTRLDVRVPNERDDAGTTKVAVRMPPGIFFASYAPQPGWKVEIQRRPLGKPVEMFGEEQTTQVGTVTFTARNDAAAIAPGQFVDFGLSVNVPEGDAGSKLMFPATQTYQGGEVVRWIGPADAERPAPQVTLTAAEEEGAAAHGDTAAGGTRQTSGPAVSADDVDGKASQGLAVTALIVGGLGLVVGAIGLGAGRRSRATV